MSAPSLRDAEALVGLPYVEGEFDCAHLAHLAQERLFGRRLQWPLPGRHPTGVRSRAAAVHRWREQLAHPVAAPQAGDVALFRHTVRGCDDWHIGTVLLALGQPWVLHTHGGLQASVLEPLQSCRRRGLHLDGYYRWRSIEAVAA
jgi:hypothetical protein